MVYQHQHGLFGSALSLSLREPLPWVCLLLYGLVQIAAETAHVWIPLPHLPPKVRIDDPHSCIPTL